MQTQHISKLPPHSVPGHDIYFPQIVSDPEGFVVTADIDEQITINGRSYGKFQPAVSVKGLRQLSRRYAGMVGGDELDLAEQRIAELEEQHDDKDTEIENLKGRLDAVDLLESVGYRARKKAGRKPAVKETE